MPIVNGLQAEFEDRLIVEKLDAAEPEVAAMQAQLDVIGHPSVVLLDSAGEPVFRGFGVQTTETLRHKIQSVLMP